MRDAAFIVLVGFGLCELRRAENAAQLDELRIVAGGDDDAAVGHRKLLIRNEVRMRIADALGKFSRHEIVERLEGERADRGIDKRRIDITAASGFFAPRSEEHT